MSIIITNITERVSSKKYGKGRQRYLIRINEKAIAEFEHRFEDGLAVCLQKAASAVNDPDRLEIQEDKELIKLLTSYGMNVE